MEIRLVYYVLGVCEGSVLSYIPLILAKNVFCVLFGYMLYSHRVSYLASGLTTISFCWFHLFAPLFKFLGVFNHALVASFYFLVCGFWGNWLLAGLGAR